MNKDLIFKCDKCKKKMTIGYGIENRIQYASIDIDEMTRPWCTATSVKHHYGICKSCLDKLIKELGEEE